MVVTPGSSRCAARLVGLAADGAQPDGTRSTRCTVLPLQATCTPNTSPRPKLKPGTPATTTVAESWPVCPRRPSRSHSPSPSWWRCGIRSAVCRPVKSSTSPTRPGSGKTTSRPSTTYGSRPVLVTRVPDPDRAARDGLGLGDQAQAGVCCLPPRPGRAVPHARSGRPGRAATSRARRPDGRRWCPAGGRTGRAGRTSPRRARAAAGRAGPPPAARPHRRGPARPQAPGRPTPRAAPPGRGNRISPVPGVRGEAVTSNGPAAATVGSGGGPAGGHGVRRSFTLLPERGSAEPAAGGP